MNHDEEIAKINRTIDEFARTMKSKMLIKHAEGYRGWDEPESKEILREKLHEHVTRHLAMGGQETDIANFAMMLWNLSR